MLEKGGVYVHGGENFCDVALIVLEIFVHLLHQLHLPSLLLPQLRSNVSEDAHKHASYPQISLNHPLVVRGALVDLLHYLLHLHLEVCLLIRRAGTG